MPVEQSNHQEIGVVTGVSGEAYAQTASGPRVLEPGSPIYQGEELVTGNNGNIEVRFVDDTLISQGGNSRIALDDYVYDPDGGASSFLGDIAEGTFRTVTGKIAEQNPDRFKLGSPLATIGIRGTIILSEVTGDGEKHGVEQIHAGKAMLLQSKATGDIRQLFSGQMVDVGSSGLLSPVRSLSAQERDSFRKIASQNIRQEQEIHEQQDDDQKDDDQVDEQNDEQNDEQQEGEQQGELPGDVDPGGGDPGETGGDGGVLHPGQGVLNPGDDALVGQQRFDPNKIDEPPQAFEKPEVEEQEEGEGQQEEQQQEEGEGDSSGDTDGDGTEEGNNANQQNQQDENEADDADTGTDDNEAGDDDTDGDSEDNPHDIHGSGLIRGTAANETLTGSSSQDTVYGEGGNDTLYGEAGDDELFGGTGNDSMYGGAGEDMLNGGSGNNYLDGGSGAADETDFASFDGQEHGVTVDLSNKNDAGEVTVSTDDGHDTLVNIEGVIGTAHKDTLTGDDNVNRFEPGLNAEYESAGAELVDGGSGSEEDWVQFETLDSKYYVNVSMTGVNGTAKIYDSTDGNKKVNEVSLSNIENIIGSSGNDKLSGNNSDNVLLGGDGNDSISGGGGNDSIDGGTGNDYISGEAGVDSIDGGAGTDSLSYDYITVGSDFGMDISLSAAGTGTATSTAPSSTIEDTFQNIERIFGTGSHDKFNGSSSSDTFDGNAGDDTIYGNGGDDILAGGAGNDEITGGAGADSISGGGGDDTIYGGDGNDIISGGAGNNHLYGGSSDGGSGTDTVSYAGHTKVNIDLGATTSHTIGGTTYTDTLKFFSTYIGSDGNDSFMGDVNGDTFVGGKGNDSFYGEGGNNLFVGGEGTDTISFANSSSAVTVRVADSTATHSDGYDTFSQVESFEGSSHGDTFYGGDNDETFSGGGGDDTVYAGTGNDTLIGGTGTNLLDGQGGTMDFVSFANASSGMNVTLDGANEVTVGTGIGTDVIKNIEGIIGSNFRDEFTGDSNNNYFRMGLNSDFVSDTSATYESVTGGDGSDWVMFDDLSSQYYVVAEVNNGYVYIKDSSDSNAKVNKVMLSSIENVLGSSGNDIMTGAGGNTLDGAAGNDRLTYAASDFGVTFNINDSDGSVVHNGGTDQFSNFEIFEGSNNDDTFNGSSNSETMFGGEGADSFSGGDGNDVITGGLGNDSIDGGAGIDTLDYSDQNKAVTIIADTGSGNGTAERTDLGEIDDFTGIENFIGSSCDDSFTGSDAAEIFEGGDGTDNIDGGAGTDFISFAGLGTGITIDLSNNAEGSGNLCTVTLGGGNDTFKNIEGVIGSNYSDNITASSSGASTIQGGGGSDTITLGGDDGNRTTLVYTSLSEGGDTINSFQNHDSDADHSDKFYFSGSDFDSSAGFETYSSGAYTGNADAGTTDAYFVFDNDNQLWYDSNGDSAGGATLIASLSGGDPVTADDINLHNN